MFILRKAFVFVGLLFSYSFSSASATNTFYRPVNNRPARNTVCNSKSCNQYVKMLRENMDLTVNPCDDFYHFSCGNFIRRNNISDDQTQVSQFRNLDKNVKARVAELLASNVLPTDDKWSRNAKIFYSSCINKNYVNQFTEPYMLKLLDDIGGWPLITGKANPHSPLELEKLLNRYGFLEFVQISISPNPKDPLSYIIKIMQPSGDPYDFFQKESYVSSYKSYFKIIASYLNPNRPVSDQDIDDIFDLEKSLAEIRLTPAERRSGTNNIEMTIGELQRKIPDFPWIDFITNGMFVNNPDIKVDESERVSIDDWNYLVKMQKIYSDYVKNHQIQLQNYIIASFFYSNINDFLPEKYLQTKLILTKEINGVKALQDRKQFCVTKAENYLPNEVGKVYVNKYFSKKAKSDALEMTTNILNEFKQMLKENTWMDAISKAKAIEKANYIKPQIGYPDNFDNATYVDKNLNYQIDKFNLLKNTMIIDEYSQRVLTLGVLRKKVDRDIWFTTPAIVNAFYEPSNNQIYFPAGILNPPFYDASLPKYLNFGGIGMVIGHEITHGFDDEGRHYDKVGRYYSDSEQGLWTQQTVDAFTKKTKCMIDQYNSFNVTEINRNINGVQTLGENIADNGGIKEAYKTYVNYMKNKLPEPKLPNVRLSQEQLLFVSTSQIWCSKIKKESLLNNVLSDTHSIPEFRVKGMVQNSDYFRAAFNCKKPTSVRSCTIW